MSFGGMGGGDDIGLSFASVVSRESQPMAKGRASDDRRDENFTALLVAGKMLASGATIIDVVVAKKLTGSPETLIARNSGPSGNMESYYLSIFTIYIPL